VIRRDACVIRPDACVIRPDACVIRHDACVIRRGARAIRRDACVRLCPANRPPGSSAGQAPHLPGRLNRVKSARRRPKTEA